MKVVVERGYIDGMTISTIPSIRTSATGVITPACGIATKITDVTPVRNWYGAFCWGAFTRATRVSFCAHVNASYLNKHKGQCESKSRIDSHCTILPLCSLRSRLLGCYLLLRQFIQSLQRYPTLLH
jgi:hypothetical protein